MKRLIAGSDSEQARGGADGAESEIEFFHPSAGNDEQPKKNGGDDDKDSAENPRPTRHRGPYPDAGSGIGDNHLPDSDQQEHYGMRQCDDGASAVGVRMENPSMLEHTVAEAAGMRL